MFRSTPPHRLARIPRLALSAALVAITCLAVPACQRSPEERAMDQMEESMRRNAKLMKRMNKMMEEQQRAMEREMDSMD